MKTTKKIKARLEYLRGELRAAQISTGELVELQSLIPHIEPGDVELLEAAGVPESATKPATPGHTPRLSYDGQGVIMEGAHGQKRCVCQVSTEYRELAPLFCAAPALLTALERFVELTDNDVICVKYSDREKLITALTQANEALGKAKQ
jgi:hypothetical protein